MVSLATVPVPRARLVVLLTLLVALTIIGTVGPALADPPSQAKRHLTMATYNVYLGGDLTPLFTAQSQECPAGGPRSM